MITNGKLYEASLRSVFRKHPCLEKAGAILTIAPVEANLDPLGGNQESKFYQANLVKVTLNAPKNLDKVCGAMVTK